MSLILFRTKTQIGLALVKEFKEDIWSSCPKAGAGDLLFDTHVSQATNGNCFMGFDLVISF